MGETPDYSDSSAFNNDLLILDTAITGSALASGAFVDVPVSQYASLLLVMNAGIVQRLQVDFHQAATVGGSGDTVEYTEYLTNPDVNITPEWLIPINCGSLRITNLSLAAVNLIGYGSNRQVARTQVMGYGNLPRSFLVTGPCTAGVVVPITNADGLQNSIQMHGQVYVRASSSSIAAFFGYRYLTAGGALRETYQGHFAAGQSFFGILALPSVPVIPVMLPDTTSASTVLGIDFTQVGP